MEKDPNHEKLLSKSQSSDPVNSHSKQELLELSGTTASCGLGAPPEPSQGRLLEVSQSSADGQDITCLCHIYDYYPVKYMLWLLLCCSLATINIILLLSHKLFALLPSVTERKERQTPTVTEHSAIAKGQTNTHHYCYSSAQGLVWTSQCSNCILADEGALRIPVGTPRGSKEHSAHRQASGSALHSCSYNYVIFRMFCGWHTGRQFLF